MEKTYNPALIQRTQRYMETHSIWNGSAGVADLAG